MKCLRRYCSVLCVCLLLSIGFSINVSAANVDVPTYKINTSPTIYFSDGTPYYRGSLDFIPDGQGERETDILNCNTIDFDDMDFLDVNTIWTFQPIKSVPLISKGGSVDFQLLNAAYSIYHQTDENSSGWKYDNDAESVRLLLFYSDGSMEYVDDVNQVHSGGNTFTSNFSVTFTPKKDVTKIELQLYNEIAYGQCKVYMGEFDNTENGWKIVVNQQSEESGLLASIIKWVKDIFNSITELPSKIWGFIENGLKSLFVPSEEFIVQFKDDMDTMLENKLGAVYQVVSITFESWDRITDSDKTNAIDMPEVSIDLPQNNSFTFGGYSVQVVPNGFDILVNAIKLITGILCTILFINGLRKRYDEIMGVEK